MFKYFKHLALNGAHQLGVLRGVNYLDTACANAVYVLVYHRVDWQNSQPKLDPQNLSATPAQFDQHMHLLSNEYHPVSAEDMLEAVLNNKRLPHRAVLVTVDDGYRDFKQHLWPIASRYGIRPVLFVPTAYVGTGVFWWDQLYDALQRTHAEKAETPVGILPLSTLSDRRNAFVQLALYMKKSPFNQAFPMIRAMCRDLISEPSTEERITLDWDELRELARAGVTVAPHTHTHPALGNIGPEQVRFEVSESQRLIMTEIGSLSTLFAYPYGLPGTVGHETGGILRDLGCQLAFTMNPGRAQLSSDDSMYLPRIESNVQLTLAQLHARLTPIYDFSMRRKQTSKID